VSVHATQLWRTCTCWIITAVPMDEGRRDTLLIELATNSSALAAQAVCITQETLMVPEPGRTK
ncbi:hypothetical protein, partial [Mesorhizobium carmichaelinearum]|uniref:hypothetical protein n=1 Tax=Mesorhizobium carmichaelinearum TaxID=1208188 RepID=UPI001AECCB7D